MNTVHDENKVRAAVSTGTVRYVLATSMTLSVIAMTIIFTSFAG